MIDDPEQGGGRHIPVAGARGWNCCTFTYQTLVNDFQHPGGFVSHTGHAAIFVGTPPADAQPDQDGDLVLDFCDNCPTVGNSTQEDADGDGDGDACDNCTALGNATQVNSDAVLAGDACECADVNTSGAANLSDVVMMRRYLAGRTNPAASARLAACSRPLPSPADPLGVRAGAQDVLAGSSPPLVQNCP